MVQSDNGGDLVLQQMVYQFIIVLYSFLIYMVSCEWYQSVCNAVILVPLVPKRLELVTHTLCQWG